jgi:hypothetical protein
MTMDMALFSFSRTNSPGFDPGSPRVGFSEENLKWRDNEDLTWSRLTISYWMDFDGPYRLVDTIASPVRRLKILLD